MLKYRPDLKYRPEYVEIVKRLCTAGHTNSEIAGYLGVDKSTFSRWQRRDRPDFVKALDRSKLPKRKREDYPLSKYKSIFDEQAKKLCMVGYENKKLAEIFGVSIGCLESWIREEKTFRDSVHQGRNLKTAEVVNALHEKAVGFTKDGRYYPPDTAAAIWITKNREPELWKDRREVIVQDERDVTPWDDIVTGVKEDK